MSGTINYNPTSWTVIGNIINPEIGSPVSTTPFTPHDCTVTVLAGTVIDGNVIIPIKVQSDW